MFQPRSGAGFTPKDRLRAGVPRECGEILDSLHVTGSIHACAREAPVRGESRANHESQMTLHDSLPPEIRAPQLRLDSVPDLRLRIAQLLLHTTAEECDDALRSPRWRFSESPAAA